MADPAWDMGYAPAADWLAGAAQQQAPQLYSPQLPIMRGPALPSPPPVDDMWSRAVTPQRFDNPITAGSKQLAGGLADMLQVPDMVRAIRGQLTSDEQQQMFVLAVMGALPGAKGALKPAEEMLTKLAGGIKAKGGPVPMNAFDALLEQVAKPKVAPSNAVPKAGASAAPLLNEPDVDALLASIQEVLGKDAAPQAAPIAVAKPAVVLPKASQSLSGPVNIPITESKTSAKPTSSGLTYKAATPEGDLGGPGDFMVHDSSGKKIAEITDLEDGGFVVESDLGPTKTHESLQAAKDAVEALHSAKEPNTAKKPSLSFEQDENDKNFHHFHLGNNQFAGSINKWSSDDKWHVMEGNNKIFEPFESLESAKNVIKNKYLAPGEPSFDVGKAVDEAIAAPKSAHVGTLPEGGTSEPNSQLGSNPGQRYRAPNGDMYYVKQTASPEHAANERLTADLYRLGGVNTLDYVHTPNDRNGVATKWAGGVTNNAGDIATIPEWKKTAQKDFAMHAWLANWDAAGLDNSNLAMLNGKPTVMDMGGGLLYRAKGAEKGKAFGYDVPEWDTLRDPKMNPQTAALFGDMTPKQLADSAKRVAAISSDDIGKMVEQSGLPKAKWPGLVDKLIERRDDIAKLGQIAEKGQIAPKSALLSKEQLQSANREALRAHYEVSPDLKPFNWRDYDPQELPAGIKDTMKMLAKKAHDQGFNVNAPVYKGGSPTYLDTFPNPLKKDEEKGNFLAPGHEKGQATAYGSALPYFLRSDSTLRVDWKQATGGKTSWEPRYMDPLIDAARKRGADLLLVDNIADSGTQGKPGTQIVVLDTKGEHGKPSTIRKPTAEFDPAKRFSANINHLLPFAVGGAAGAGLLYDQQKRGGL